MAEERREQVAASVARVADKNGWAEADTATTLAIMAHSLADIAAANPDAPWSQPLRMQEN